MNIFEIPQDIAKTPSQIIYENIGKKLAKNILIEDYCLGLPINCEETLGHSMLALAFQKKTSGNYNLNIINIPKRGLCKSRKNIYINKLTMHNRGEWILCAYRKAIAEFLKREDLENCLIPINTNDHCSWSPALTSDISHNSGGDQNFLIPTEYDARLLIAYKELNSELFEYMTNPSNIGRMRVIHKKIWREKKSILFWRGGANGPNIYRSAGGMKANLRTHLCLIHQGKKNIDMKITRNTHNIENISGKIHKITAKEISNKEFFGYKYFPDIKGSVRAWGTIFRHLQGSLVLREEDNENLLCIDMYMKPWRDYIPVKKDFSNIEDIVEWCSRNDQQSMEIAFNGYLKSIQYMKDSESTFSNAVSKIYHEFGNESITHLPSGKRYSGIQKIISFSSYPGMTGISK
ncbi:glycosyl transferase family 90 [Synechococcus sp. A15-28]|uniref:glycosyl transferase family 90 n=1 Tax=Synechococcus sp. A15-28 TaxID=1050638 RepID=UPI001646B878|nr:glycosyl transferase family 90 [Synechococcus sp. A15-28]QNI41238.1 glycosyl transferase 90 family protein [Synechococcus sp. A15-28]